MYVMVLIYIVSSLDKAVEAHLIYPAAFRTLESKPSCELTHSLWR